MNREYNCTVTSKNSEQLLKNLHNTTGDYFWPHTVYQAQLSPTNYIWGVIEPAVVPYNTALLYGDVTVFICIHKQS